MVSWQLESDVEVSPHSPRGTYIVAMCESISQILMVALLFKNHFVVGLLWPCRERGARGNPMVMSNILNALLTNSNSELDVESRTRSFSVNISSRCAKYITGSQSEYLLCCIVDRKTKPWHCFVFSSLVLHDKEECECSESDVESRTRTFFGEHIVAVCESISRTQFQKECEKSKSDVESRTRSFLVNISSRCAKVYCGLRSFHKPFGMNI